MSPQRARVPAPGSRGLREASSRNPGLELFFDLIFVLCVAQLAESLHREPTPAHAAGIVLLFVPVWWAWTGVTFVLNRFPTDDDLTNVALLLAAAASGAMALAIPSVPGSGNYWFALGYGSVRIILSLMYLRARAYDTGLARFYAVGFGLTGCVWFASVALPGAAQPYAWGAVMCVDILIPVLADRTQRISPVDEHHLPDRFSAFAIIVLGEAAVSAVGVVGERLTRPVVVVLAEGFLLAALLWWGFFDRTAWRTRYAQLTDRDSSGRIAYVVCAYLHFPIVAGVIFVAAGTQLAVDHPTDEVPTPVATLIAAGIAAYLVTMNAMTWVLRTPRQQSLAWLRTVLAIMLAGWWWWGRSQTVPVYLAGCAAVLVLHVAANVGRAHRARPPAGAPTEEPVSERGARARMGLRRIARVAGRSADFAHAAAMYDNCYALAHRRCTRRTDDQAPPDRD